MPRPRSKIKKWWIIIAEFFFIVKFYDWFNEWTGMDPATYFIIAFIIFWGLNWLLFNKLFLTRSPASTLTFKVSPRHTFTDDFFGIGVAMAILFGFGLGKSIGSIAVIIALIIFVLVFAYRLIFSYDNILRQTWGLIVLGFIFGMSLATPLSNNVIVIFIFALMHFILYISKDPGES